RRAEHLLGAVTFGAPPQQRCCASQRCDACSQGCGLWHSDRCDRCDRCVGNGFPRAVEDDEVLSVNDELEPCVVEGIADIEIKTCDAGIVYSDIAKVRVGRTGVNDIAKSKVVNVSAVRGELVELVELRD